MPMPVELQVVMEDGTTRGLKLPVEVWYGGDRYNLLVPDGKKVVKVTIDPRGIYPDVRRENNTWSAPGAGVTTGPGTTSR
jgi:hypothetical protein